MKLLPVLKGLEWNRVGDFTFEALDCENEIYEMTGFHIPTANKLANGNPIKYNLLYQKKDGKIMFVVKVWNDYCDNPIFTDSTECDGDILELFPAEEINGELKSFFSGEIGEVINRFKEKFPNVYDAIVEKNEQSFVENLADLDMPSDVKRDIAESWIEDNPSDAFDMAKDCVSDWDVKEFVKDYINDNL